MSTWKFFNVDVCMCYKCSYWHSLAYQTLPAPASHVRMASPCTIGIVRGIIAVPLHVPTKYSQLQLNFKLCQELVEWKPVGWAGVRHSIPNTLFPASHIHVVSRYTIGRVGGLITLLSSYKYQPSIVPNQSCGLRSVKPRSQAPFKMGSGNKARVSLGET